MQNEKLKIVQKLPRNVVMLELGKQLLRAGTSIASNIEEAQGAFSKDDIERLIDECSQIKNIHSWEDSQDIKRYIIFHF